MTFQVGEKVVCVRVDGNDGRFGLRISDIYTISKLGLGYGGGQVCDVAEIKTALSGAWRADCFRRIVSRQTSIEIFRAMLNPSKQEIDA